MFSFLFFPLPNVYWSCDHLLKYCTYLLKYIYICMYVSSPISPCVVSFLSLYTCFFMYAILHFYFTQDALMSFV